MLANGTTGDRRRDTRRLVRSTRVPKRKLPTNSKHRRNFRHLEKDASRCRPTFVGRQTSLAEEPWSVLGLSSRSEVASWGGDSGRSGLGTRFRGSQNTWFDFRATAARVLIQVTSHPPRPAMRQSRSSLVEIGAIESPRPLRSPHLACRAGTYCRAGQPVLDLQSDHEYPS